jgi:hypothetical protein
VIIQVGGNVLDCDVEATIAAFRAYTPELPWACACSGCRNYRAAQDLIYAGPVLHFFSQFGIDTTKPSEIYEGGLIGEIFYCFCWFHFVGTILDMNHPGSDAAPSRLTPVFTWAAMDISEAVKVDFHNKQHLLPDSSRVIQWCNWNARSRSRGSCRSLGDPTTAPRKKFSAVVCELGAFA